MKELDNSFFSLIDKNEIYMEIDQLLERRLKTANKNIEKYLYKSPLLLVIICFYSTLSFPMNKKFPNLLTIALFILFITLTSLQSKKITKLLCRKDHKYYTLCPAIFLNLVIAFYSQLFLFLIRYMDLLNILYFCYLEVSLLLLVNYYNHHSLKITLIKVFLNIFAQLVFTVSLNRDSLTMFSVILNSFSLLIFSQVLERMLISQMEMQIILKKERNYFLHVIDRTESGYVCLKSNKVLISNQNFQRILYNCIKTESLYKTDILEFIFQNFQNVNKLLPKNVYDLLNRFNSTPVQEKKEKNNEYFINDSDYDSEEASQSNNIVNNDPISFESIIKEIFKCDEFSNFFSLGIIQFKNVNKDLDQEIMFYEVFLRISKCNYEIILKNYNKNKEVEEANIVLKNNSIYLAKVAHELKNPLITITSILESDFKSSFSQEQLNFNSDFEIGTPKLSNTKSNGFKKNNKFIMTLCNYLMYLIEDLNYFSKNILVNNYYHKQTTEDIIYQPFNILNACEFCINIFKIRQKNDPMKSNLKIILEYDRNIPKFLHIPETKFKQILINLFSNAYKFTIHGYIKLALKNINNIINEEKSRRLIRIIIEDTGLGISKDNQEHIFECFHKIDKHQKYNQYGSGLGLTIVRELVSSINSKIQFESEENKGSKFWFDIEVFEKLDENETLLENGQIVHKFPSQKTFKTLRIENNNMRFTESLKNVIYYPRNSDASKDEALSFNREFSQDSKIFENHMSHLFNNCESSKNENESGIYSVLSPKIKAVKSKFSLKSLPNLVNDKSEENSKIKILVCDDEDTIRKSICRQLEKVALKEGVSIQIQESTNGIECLYEIYKAILQGNGFSGLLIDENMPFMKGSLCVQTLRAMAQERLINQIKMCIVSSYDDENIFSFSKKQGPDLILKKPPTFEDINRFFNIIYNANH